MLYYIISVAIAFVSAFVYTTTLTWNIPTPNLADWVMIRAIIPAMNFSPEVLTDPAASREYLQLMISHEYTHYVQWKSGEVPASSFMFGERNWTDWQEVRVWFLAELAAHEQECQLAGPLGWIDIIPSEIPECVLYVRGGRRALAQQLAESYLAQIVELMSHAEHLRALAAAQ